MYNYLILDVNECLDFACSSHSICNNTIGSFTCTCLNGFYEHAGLCLGEDITVLHQLKYRCR